MAGELPTTIGSPSQATGDGDAGKPQDQAQKEALLEEAAHTMKKNLSNNKTSTVSRKSQEISAKMLTLSIVTKGAAQWKSKTIEDRDEEEEKSGSDFQESVRKFVTWQYFDFAIGSVIVLNAITIGAGLQTGDQVWEDMELIFVIIYSFELSMHFIADGRHCLHDNWIKADVFFVMSGWLSTILDATLFNDENANNNYVDQLMLLRTLRLLKCARPLRLLKAFKELWTMVSGLMSSGTTITYTIVLITAMLYIFACLGLELVTLSNIDKDESCTYSKERCSFEMAMKGHFSSLGKAMLTLTQFVAMDSVSGFYTPIILYDNLTLIFFTMVVLIIGIVLMNLVTAVVVENAMQNSANDKSSKRAEERESKKKLMVELKELVTAMDADGSGIIDIYELSKAPPATRRKLCDLINVGGLMDIYKTLDIDPNEPIAVDDFFDYIHHWVSYDGSEQMHWLERNIMFMEERCAFMEQSLQKVCKSHGLPGKDKEPVVKTDAEKQKQKFAMIRLREEARKIREAARRSTTEEGSECAETKMVVVEEEGIRASARKLTRHWAFDPVVGLIIVGNSFTLGYNLQMKCMENTTDNFTEEIEFVFLVIFTFELILHFLSDAVGVVLKNGWIQMDVFFISVGWMDRIGSLIAPDSPVSAPGWLMLLRTFRLLKCAKPLRLIYRFKEMWTLVSGLMCSVGTILYTLFLLIAIIYIFACLGVELITLNSFTTKRPDTWKAVESTYFRNLWVAMLTLTQFLGMDSVSGVYTDLVKEDPYMLGIYFSGVVLVIPVVLMNLITAVVVDKALQGAADDAEQQEKFKAHEEDLNVLALRKQLRDLGKTGHIDMSAILNAPLKVKEVLVDLLHVNCPSQVFSELYLDPTQSYEMDEFFDAILRFRAYDGSHAQRRLERSLEMAEFRYKKLEVVMEKLMITLTSQPPPEPPPTQLSQATLTQSSLPAIEEDTPLESVTNQTGAAEGPPLATTEKGSIAGSIAPAPLQKNTKRTKKAVAKKSAGDKNGVTSSLSTPGSTKSSENS